jgi:hypothetical protein
MPPDLIYTPIDGTSTFRGILDHYSGFLYVPAGGSPESFSVAVGDHFIEVIPLDPHWFFVASA